MITLTASTTISVQEVTVTSDGEFLRLSDKKPGETISEDRMTVGQAAETLSDIFGKGTCGQQDQADAYTAATDLGQSLNTAASNYLSAKYPGTVGVAELAEKFGIQSACVQNLSGTGKQILPVYVHASSDDIFDDYQLVSYGSASSGPQIVEEDIQIRFEFTRSASLPVYYWIDYEKLEKYLKYPLLYGTIFEWRGSPKDNRGERVDPPAVSIKGGQVLLHGYYSGILIVRRLPIKYHIWKITLTGTALGDGKREYKGRVSAISSAYGLGPVDQQVGESDAVQDKAAECPLDDGNPIATDDTGAVVVCSRDSSGELVCSGGDDDPKGEDIFCFIEIKKELRKQCKNSYVSDLPTEYRKVDCPDTVTPTRNTPGALNYNPALPKYYKKIGQKIEYIYTQEGVDPQITAEEYEKICCHPPVSSPCIPFCREIKSTHRGPLEIEGGRQKYIDEYAGKTVFVPVGTETGICGTLTDRFVDSDLLCCGDVETLHIDTDNSAETVAPSSFCIVTWTGGKAKVKVTVSGQGFWLNPGYTVKYGSVEDGKSVTIYTSGDNCGTGTVIVDDGCSVVDWDVRSTAGQWTERTASIDWEPLSDEWFFVLLTPASCGLAAEGYETGEIVTGKWKYQNITCSKGGADTWARLQSSDFTQKERYSGLDILRAKPYLDLSSIGGEGWAYTHTFVVYLWEWTC